MILEGGRHRQATMNSHESQLTPPYSQMTVKKEILFYVIAGGSNEETNTTTNT